jgi:membrane protease YdiL (CAAX protease family)
MFYVFVFGSLLVLAGLAWATYLSGRLLRTIPLRENLLLAPVENVVKAGLVGLCIGLGLISGLPPARLGWSLENPARDLAIGLVVGLVVQFMVNRLTFWVVERFGKAVYSPVVLKNILPRSRRDWLLVPAAMLLAVLLEELLFRSLLLGGLGTLVPPLVLVVVLGAVFGWMHAPQGPLGVVVTGALGGLLGLLFLWTGGLLAPLVAHYLINMLQLVRAREVRYWLQEY